MTVQVRVPLPVYAVGTISGNAGSPVITGANTNFQTQDSAGNTLNSIQPGDALITSTVPIPIKSVDSATQITLEFSLPTTINSGSSYRIIKYQPNLTGGVTAALIALQNMGSDVTPVPSIAVDNGAGRAKLRIGPSGDVQLAVGPSGTADAALTTALDISSTGAVTIGAGDFPGLTYDIPTGISPAQMLALGQQNANIIGLATLRACRAGMKRLTLPERKIVLANQTASGVNPGSPAMYIGGGFAPADEFFWGLDGTQIIMAGTDRNSSVGLASVGSIAGPCGISGSGSVDYYYPQSACGYISKVIDSTHFIATLDHAWGVNDVDKILAYDPIYDRWTGRVAYAVGPATSPAAYIPISLATGSNQITGYDYLIDLSTSASPAANINAALLTAGQEIAISQAATNFLFSAQLCDKFILPSELRIYQACNGVFYGQATSLDTDCHCEARLIQSALSRGRFRRRLFASGGYLFTPSELSSNIGGAIIGTEDDACDIAGFSPQISAVNSTSSINVAANDVRLPQQGQQVSLLDTTRTIQATLLVVSTTINANGSVTINFNGSMPNGVAVGWVIQTVTTSRGVFIKSTFRSQISGACALRVSQQSIKIGDGAVLGPSMGPALQLSGGGTTEYESMPRVHIGNLHIISGCSGLGFERTAAVSIHNTNYPGNALAASTAFGDVHIDNLTVSGICNGPALAVAGVNRFFGRSVTAQGINANPTNYGPGTGYAVTFENVGYAYLGELTQYEQLGNAQVGCVGVNTYVMGENVDGPVPASGVINLTAYNKWITYAPTFTPGSGSFTAAPTSGTYSGTAGTAPATSNGFKYRLLRGKSFEMEGRIDIPANYGTASGLITMTLPFTLGPSAWKGSVFSNEQSRNLWVATQSPGATTVNLYQQASPGTLAQAALFFEMRGETA